MSWIEWCKCHRRILTTGQQNEGRPCDLCMEELKAHAKTLPDRIEAEIKKEEQDGSISG